MESTIHLSLRGGICFHQQRKRLTRKELHFLKNERYFAFIVRDIFQKCGKNTRGRKSNRVRWSMNPNEHE